MVQAELSVKCLNSEYFFDYSHNVCIVLGVKFFSVNLTAKTKLITFFSSKNLDQKQLNNLKIIPQ